MGSKNPEKSVKRSIELNNQKPKSQNRTNDSKSKTKATKSISTSYSMKSLGLQKKQKLSREKIKFKPQTKAGVDFSQSSKPSIGKMIPPKTQRDTVFFNACMPIENSNDLSALGKSVFSTKNLKLGKSRLANDLRESKTPRDIVPKLHVWEGVREKGIEGEISQDDSIRPEFDKEKYMKNNCINNRTKLQLDQVQNHESK